MVDGPREDRDVEPGEDSGEILTSVQYESFSGPTKLRSCLNEVYD